MKPIRLFMKNFGPFVESKIDFSTLSPMFLITGKTGSGKTAIFDAITYALFGRFSGGRRVLKLEHMVCDFAKDGEESFVEFEFCAGGSVFRAKRTLPTKSKSGKTTRNAELSLEEFDSEQKKWKIFKGHTTGQLDAIISEEIIGLKYDEFNQIVLLPQGEFSKFLKEKSKDRTETLKKLFPVDAITRTIESVREKSKDARENLSFLESKIAEMEKKIGSLDALSEQIEQIEKESKDCDEKLQIAQKAKSESENALHFAKTEGEKARKHEESRKTLLELESFSKEIDEDEKKLALSLEALSLFPKLEKNRSAKTAAQDAKNAEIEKSEAEKNAKDAFETFENQTEKRENQKKQLKNDEKELDSLKEVFKKIAAIKKAKEQAEQAEKDAQKSLDAQNEAQKKVETILKQILDFSDDEKNTDARTVLRFLSEKTKKAEEQLNQKKEETKNAQKCSILQKKAKDAKKSLLEAEENRKNAEIHFYATKEILDHLLAEEEENKRKNSASILAHFLKDGKECPVCGSKVHPAPAHFESTSLSDKIDAQKINKEKAEEAFLLASKNEGAAKEIERIAREEAQAQFLICSKSEEAALKAENEAEKIALDAKKNEENALSLFEKLSEEEETLLKLKEQYTTLKAKSKTAQTIFLEKKAEAGEWTDDEKLSLQIAKLEEAVEKNAKEITEAEKNKKDAELLWTKAKTEYESAKKVVAETAKAEKIAADDFLSALSRSSFLDEEQLEKSILEKDEETKIRQKIEKIKTETQKAKTIFESTETQKSEAEFLEIEKVETEKIEKLQKEIDYLIEQAKRVFGEKKEAENAKSEFETAQTQILEKRKENEVLIKLARDLCGENPLKIPFDAWVLSMHFSEVIDYANARFLNLSGGRYQFKIEKTRTAGFHGLDIAIEDFFTGLSRDSATLSGGETFEAAISLALALTDVVCSKSGGVRLDSLFIDEGFGSLDAESLDSALLTLKKIGKERTVGIISHVEGMKTEIPSHLEIKKGNAGRSVIQEP